VKPRFWPSNSEVYIGQRAIGFGHPVFIIAEAGVNHNGKFDLALKLVEAAKRSGADAVKFQVFSADTLVVPNAPTADYQLQKGHTDQRAMLRELELSRQEFVDLFHYCKNVGIEFLATPFTIDDLNFLQELGVSAIKLASPEVVNFPLLERAIDSKLPVILSTGASTIHEIDNAVETFSNRAALSRLILLHCISSYPTSLNETNLSIIGNLSQRFPVPVGFSDHTQEWITGALAVSAGAKVLEKHFTLDRTMVGPDHLFSLDETQLVQYIASAREAQTAMGNPNRQLLPIELDVRNLSRGSVVSSVEILEGTFVTPAMLTVKRPGGGIEPARIKELVGLKARVTIPPDTRIEWTMLETTSEESIDKSFQDKIPFSSLPRRIKKM
jgi:N-acetylneuraminate synthase/N,N'-diacetyllegionaminate synthase